jgi:uncharacterized ion transporter superfamily protein YfcC
MTKNKQKYENARHHAWAGSVLLAVLLAIRLIIETTSVNVDDRIILGIAVILIIYTLIAVIFTYRYRTGITDSSEQKVVHIHKTEDAEKERLKVEKKKAKAEAKKAKKQNK